mgnify:CR=1 FL=1
MKLAARRSAAIAAIAAFAGAGILGSGSQAQAGVDDVTFAATTSAYGMEFRFTNPTIPTGIPIEGSGPTTGANLNSLPESTAFASLPYPGETGANASGLVAGVTGLPVPSYPFYISSRNGSPPPTGGHYPGIDLSARTTDNLSTSKAVAFTDAAGYVAESTISQAKDGTVTAASTATQNGMRIGDTLVLAGVESMAQAVLDSAGKLSTSSSLTVSRFVAPALNLSLPEQFCPPNAACVPNPFKGQVLTSPALSYTDGVFYVEIPGTGSQKYPVPDAAVAEAFKGIGVDMKIQKAVTSSDGITAPTFVLTTELPALPDNQLYNGPTPVTYTIGRTSASIEGSLVDSGTGLTGLPLAGGTAGATDAAAGAEGALGTDAIAAPGLGVGVLPSTSTPATVGLSPAAGSGGEQYVATREARPLAGIAPLYLVLIGVGLVGFAAGPVLAYVGVRSAWKS